MQSRDEVNVDRIVNEVRADLGRITSITAAPERWRPWKMFATFACMICVITRGSLLIQNGASIVYVEERKGHSSIQVTVDTWPFGSRGGGQLRGTARSAAGIVEGRK